jgi:hypothetical protein
MSMILELPAPGMQDAGEPREGGPDAALVGSEPLAGRCRGVKHGLGREALVGAEEGPERLRDGEGQEDVRPGQVFVPVVVEPLLGFMLRTLRAMTIAPGLIATVLPPTVLALREAVTVRAAWALLAGTDALARRNGERRVALQVLGRKGGANIAEGGHGRRPCMRALRRS